MDEVLRLTSNSWTLGSRSLAGTSHPLRLHRVPDTHPYILDVVKHLDSTRDLRLLLPRYLPADLVHIQLLLGTHILLHLLYLTTVVMRHGFNRHVLATVLV